MPNHSQLSVGVFNNRSFLDDDSNPPSYSSIFPLNETNKEHQKSNDPAVLQDHNHHRSTSIIGNLFQNSQEPISYQELFSHQVNHDEDDEFNHRHLPTSSYSTRYLFNQQNEDHPRRPVDLVVHNNFNGSDVQTTSSVIIQQPNVPLAAAAAASVILASHSLEYGASQNEPHSYRNNSKMRQQFKKIFTKSFLFKHFIFTILLTIMMILFQIILTNNQSVLSHFASGVWCGLINLLTISITLVTLKYAKVWLLIISIICHFICITISLGSFIVINSVAASRYGVCPYNPYFNDNFYEPMDKNNCSLNMKYANIALIVIGATCMVMFVSFFIKLVSAFNSLNSSTTSSSSSPETY